MTENIEIRIIPESVKTILAQNGVSMSGYARLRLLVVALAEGSDELYVQLGSRNQVNNAIDVIYIPADTNSIPVTRKLDRPFFMRNQYDFFADSMLEGYTRDLRHEEVISSLVEGDRVVDGPYMRRTEPGMKAIMLGDKRAFWAPISLALDETWTLEGDPLLKSSNPEDPTMGSISEFVRQEGGE